MNEALAAQRAGLDPIALGPAVLEAVPGVRADLDAFDIAPSLPNDHPAWQRDVVSISARARALIATIRPFVVRVLSIWDHTFGEIAIGARTFGIDPSGCYRLR